MGRAVLTRDDPHASNALLPSDAILRCFGCGRLDDAPVGVDAGGGDLAGGVGVEEEGDACGALVMDIPSVSDDGGCLEGSFGSEIAGSDWEREFVYMCVGGEERMRSLRNRHTRGNWTIAVSHVLRSPWNLGEKKAGSANILPASI